MKTALHLKTGLGFGSLRGVWSIDATEMKTKWPADGFEHKNCSSALGTDVWYSNNDCQGQLDVWNAFLVNT